MFNNGLIWAAVFLTLSVASIITGSYFSNKRYWIEKDIAKKTSSRGKREISKEEKNLQREFLTYSSLITGVTIMAFMAFIILVIAVMMITVERTTPVFWFISTGFIFACTLASAWYSYKQKEITEKILKIAESRK